ncbi:hypothetical protein RJ639_019834 [Escallonia herrerae]|uniref:GAG-pre-integrase domain-containing protein n=1 Tax=Escallonia herrerae TaxID=1293975 RepID=A0AA88VAH6_9ASTE|nr:hypothetical protein RJ639_019834 [Escallonia herrerae]
MLSGDTSILKTHYDILGVKEDACLEEIYRFLEIQKAWELLGNIQSRGVYDTKLRALRQDAIGVEDVIFEDLTVEDAVTISSSNGGWILDMGYSYHMYPNKDWFATYHSFDGGKVLMENDVACKVVGIGSIQIRMHDGIVRTLTDVNDGIVRTLTDVRHVLELRKNLISLGTLDFNRVAGGVMRIMKDALVVMKRLKQNSLHLLKGSTITVVAVASSSDIDFDTTKLWHMRLGHMSERGMDVRSKQCLL